MKNNRIPGPTELPPAVRNAVNQQMMSHRSEAFKTVFASTSQKLQRFLHAKNIPLFLTCSGTGGLEAAILNTLNHKHRVLALSAGYYGDLFTQIAKKHLGENVTALAFTPGTAIDLETVSNILQKQAFDAVLLTHSESSTGVLNPVPELAALIQKHSNALILVDAISSVGTTDINVEKWGIDVLITVSQKGLMAPPGLSMITLSDRVLNIIEQGSAIGSFYLDFKYAYDTALTHQTAFTPAVLSIWGVNAALDLIETEGAQHVFSRHKRLSLACQKGVTAAGFKLFAEANFRAPALTSVCVPPGTSAQSIQKYLEEEYDIFVAVGVGPWENKIFRIGHMGWVFDQEIEAVTHALENLQGKCI